jgi:glycine/D-amino acid oxidase-like deaminating enzyme
MIAEGAVLSEGFKSTLLVGCALELAEQGARPVVIEAGALGAGASTRSGAMVTGGPHG